METISTVHPEYKRVEVGPTVIHVWSRNNRLLALVTGIIDKSGKPIISFTIQSDLIPTYPEDQTFALDELKNGTRYPTLNYIVLEGYAVGSTTCEHNASLGLPDFVGHVKGWLDSNAGNIG